MREQGKARAAEIKMIEVFNSTVVGIVTLWLVWVSSSLLIHIFK
jgi:hypothetical protein